MSSEQYADVTIFCEGALLKVHKLVLIASSTHFERILHNMPDNQHPFIVLDGTRLADIQGLIEYMYKGEVNIQQDNLQSLLKTAQTLHIKGLFDYDGVCKRPVSRNGCRDESERDMESNRHHSSHPTMSPPPKRSRISPVDTLLLRDQGIPDPRDLRHETRSDPPRETSGSRLGHIRDMSRDSSRDSRDMNREPTIGVRNDLSRDHSRESNRDSKLGHRDHSLDVPRDLSAHNFPPMVGSSTTGNGWGSSGTGRKLTPPIITSPSPMNRNIPPYYSRPSQYDSSLLPPRSSPKSPGPEKVPPQLGIPPFNLPFNLPNLPMLGTDSKKILERTSQMLLPNTRYESEETREKERLVSSWTSVARQNEIESDFEHGRDKSLDRERENNERYTILQKTLLQHKQQQNRERDLREREQLERDREQRDQQYHQQKSALLSFQLSQQQHQFTTPNQLTSHQSQISSQYSPHYSQSSTATTEAMDLKDSKDVRNIKDINGMDRSPEDNKSITPPHDKSQFSPPSDVDSGGSAKNESDSLVMDEDEEDSRSSIGGSNVGRGDSATDLSTTGEKPLKPKALKKQLGTTGSDDRVKCPHCPRAYRHQNNLRTHIRCFHKGIRIPCPICQRGFTRWFTVRCHIAREHTDVDLSRPERLPAQLRKVLMANQSDPRPTMGSYQDELGLRNTAVALSNYGDNGPAPRVLPTQP